MAEFTCSVQGCSQPAKPGFGGLCFPHGIEEARRRDGHTASGIPEKKDKAPTPSLGCEHTAGTNICRSCRLKAIHAARKAAGLPGPGRPRKEAPPPVQDKGPAKPETNGGENETKPPVSETAAVTDVPVMAPRSGPWPTLMAALPPDDRMKLGIDFGRYPILYQNLRALAEKEFRTPENQLLYLLHQHLTDLESIAKEAGSDGLQV